MTEQFRQRAETAAPACPVCTASATAHYAAAPDRLFGIAAGDFHLCRCRACGAIFQHPMPDAAAVASFYPEDYWWSENDSSALSRFFSRLERRYREFVAQGHVRFLMRCAGGGGGGRTVLDIGCGSGTFLHLARRYGFQPSGMDLSEHAVAAARTQYGLQVIRGGIGCDVWHKTRFDFVTMFHVLEHVPAPGEALRYAGGLLNPGGVLILQVPNAASLQARLFRTRWYGLDVPRHLINFTPRSLRCLLDEEQFDATVEPRFSLRDNPAALASSLAPGWDPIGRRGRKRRHSAIREGVIEGAYLGLFLLSVAPAWCESILGCGATLWVQARLRHPDSPPASS